MTNPGHYKVLRSKLNVGLQGSFLCCHWRHEQTNGKMFISCSLVLIEGWEHANLEGKSGAHYSIVGSDFLFTKWL